MTIEKILSKIDLVVTDVGGVLIKTDEAIISCIQRVVMEQGIPDGSLDSIYTVFGVSLKEYIKAYLPDGYKDRTDECYRNFKKVYPATVLHVLKPFEGVDETLDHLKRVGIRVAVLSCMLQTEVETSLSLLKFRAFDAVFSLEDYGEDHTRPDPDGLRKLIAKLGCTKGRTIYVGDSESDVLMGRNAGVISIAVKSGVQPKDYIARAQPDFTVDSFRDIVRIIDIIGSGIRDCP